MRIHLFYFVSFYFNFLFFPTLAHQSNLQEPSNNHYEHNIRRISLKKSVDNRKARHRYFSNLYFLFMTQLFFDSANFGARLHYCAKERKGCAVKL